MEVKYERDTILIKRGILKGKVNLYWVATSILPPPLPPLGQNTAFSAAILDHALVLAKIQFC